MAPPRVSYAGIPDEYATDLVDAYAQSLGDNDPNNCPPWLTPRAAHLELREAVKRVLNRPR